MKMVKILALLAILFGITAGSALATVVTGDVEATVNNTFGQQVGNVESNCSSCIFTISPQLYIANNATSNKYVAVASPPNPQGAPITTIVRYEGSISGHLYGCQFSVSNVFSNSSGVCPSYTTVNISAGSFEGVYPSPHCTHSIPTVAPTTCNVTAAFFMAP